MLWNRLDSSVDWVNEIERITKVGQTSGRPDADEGPPAWPGFAEAELSETSWRQRLTHDDLVELAGTWSAVSTAPDHDRSRILAQVRAVAAAVPPGDGHAGTLDLAYICTVWTYH